MTKGFNKSHKLCGGGTLQSQRDSNLELFRIITMLLIIAHHYVVNSGLTEADGPIYSDPLSAPSLFLLLFGAWGKIGINCFVLITGYFMCEAAIRPRKFIKLLLEIMFYKCVIQTVFWGTGYEAFSIKALAKMLLPIPSVTSNFAGCFLLFYLSIPFLNLLAHAMNEKQHLRLLALLLFIYTFFGTVPLLHINMNYVSWFAVLYFLASYMRLYPKKIFGKTAFWGWMALLALFISGCSVIACAWLGMKMGRNMAFAFVTDSNTFLAVATALCAFLFFKNLRIKRSVFINTVASSVFGVLMIHANSDTMRQWLWRDTLNNVGAYGKPWMAAHAIGSVIGIFAICAALDQLRIRMIEMPAFRLLDAWWERNRARFERLEQRLCIKLKIE